MAKYSAAFFFVSPQWTIAQPAREKHVHQKQAEEGVYNNDARKKEIIFPV